MSVEIISEALKGGAGEDGRSLFGRDDTVVDAESIHKATTRLHAIKAVQAGTATQEQRRLLSDLDDAISQRRAGRNPVTVAGTHSEPVAPALGLVSQNQPRPATGYKGAPQRSRR